jgi:N-acetylmuramoyl-L-alanine amidase
MKGMKKILKNLVSGSLIVLVILAAGGLQPPQTMAATVNDIDCALVGGYSGTCYYRPCETNGAETAGDSLVGGSNEEKVFNFFVGKGLTDVQTAGIMGNMSQESGFEPQRVEGGGESKTPTSGGWGLIQWTPGTKILGIAKEAKIDTPIHELGTQLEIVWWHMNNISPTSRSNILPEFKKKATNPKTAASAFEELMEGAGTPAMANRWAAAEAAMRKYGGKGGGGGESAPGSDSSEGGCQCTEQGGSGTTVVLDPGHSGSTVNETDPESGIKAQDSDNGQETKDMWKLSEDIKGKLEKKGYKVISTKKSEQDSVGLIARAKIANDAKAAIAVSLHSTPGDKSDNWVTPQEVGLYRETGGKKKTFEDKEVAKKSQEYADIMVAERKKAEGNAKIHPLDFPASRQLPATGNISIVQLFSKVPWVYNEAGQDTLDLKKYAEGVTNAIEKSLGDAKGEEGAAEGKNEEEATFTGCSDDGAVTGDLIETVKKYAWPDYRGPGFVKPKPAYAQAIDKSDKDKIYNGGLRYNGIDCGGFVTLAMIYSGYEPEYNSSGKGGFTGSPSAGNTQWGWLEKNWKKINPKSTKDHLPGDVAINSGHTYMYVGKVDGFNSEIASASLDSRAPMAGKEMAAAKDFTWYRKD